MGISPTAVVVKVNTTLTFTPFGGNPPYTFSKDSGDGSNSHAASVVYSALSGAGGATIRVTDSSVPTPAFALATVTVDDTGLTLGLSPSTITMAINSDATFHGTGGMPPYTYAIQSTGSGSPLINAGTGALCRRALPGTDVIRSLIPALPTPATATATVAVTAFATNVDYAILSESLVAGATTGYSGVSGEAYGRSQGSRATAAWPCSGSCTFRRTPSPATAATWSSRAAASPVSPRAAARW